MKNDRSSISVRILIAFLVCFWPRYSLADWKTDWDKTVQAAEKEGQVTVSIGGYGAIIDSGAFQKAFPKIRVTHLTGAGTDLTQRISAERRAGKYLVDVYNGGGNSLYQVLYS